jgi:hypothetical protein
MPPSFHEPAAVSTCGQLSMLRVRTPRSPPTVRSRPVPTGAPSAPRSRQTGPLPLSVPPPVSRRETPGPDEPVLVAIDGSSTPGGPVFNDEPGLWAGSAVPYPNLADAGIATFRPRPYGEWCRRGLRNLSMRNPASYRHPHVPEAYTRIRLSSSNVVCPSWILTNASWRKVCIPAPIAASEISSAGARRNTSVRRSSFITMTSCTASLPR